MTNNELEIVRYLEKCKTVCNTTEALQVTSDILDHINKILDTKAFTFQSTPGICILCKNHTTRIVHGEYCRTCYDQFVD